ncbi:META domain-containing protein [Nocardioides jishulii]|uniref:META domain-containing protein n=1 Tax=Nocardioides jishulii TaxID=2575440 RepID=A0A4U2YWT2_9ACTN|nr:META domain-containing protein [Nocardioides jishulii]QCX28476.1 META domain-containing protein [Nocardioides jishulii]TKI64631.1 META domain-containing protein [Nocardioides jishulii]
MWMRRGTAAVLAVMLGTLLAGCGQDSETDPKNLNGTWVLVEFQDGTASDPLIETVMTLKDGRVSGNAGVNDFKGAYEAKDDGTISFEDISTEKSAGPQDATAQEGRFLDSLAKVASFEVDEAEDKDDRTELELKNNVGVTLLSFIEAP